MDQSQIQQFLTPERVKEIFEMLNITPNTSEADARARISQYLSTNQLVAQLYHNAAENTASTHPLDIQDDKQQNLLRKQDYQSTQIEQVRPNTQAFGQRFIREIESVQVLQVRILRAEGFASPESNGVLSIHMRAGPGRACSRAIPFSDTPQFGELFEMCLSNSQTLNLVQCFHVLKFAPLQFIIVHRRIDGSSGIFGQAELTVQEIMEICTSSKEKQIKLFAFGSQDEITGLLYVNLQLHPQPKRDANENQKLNLAIQQFEQESRQYADQYKYNCHLFMSELQNARPGHKQYVALTLVTDNGHQVPAPSIIQPIYCKQLNSVQKAYRFVNLIPEQISSQQLRQVWARPYATLVQNCGSEEDKAVLLCSLFRGMQMPAFVAIGKTDEGHAFVGVVCVYGVRVQIYYKEEVYHFKQQSDGSYLLEEFTNDYEDSQTVQQFDWARLDCLFNDVDVFANLQAYSDRIRLIPASDPIGGVQNNIQGGISTAGKRSNHTLVNISFHLSRPTLFKRLNSELLVQLQRRAQLGPPLSYFGQEAADECGSSLEQKLWQLIAARRADVGLNTPRSEALSALLGQCLESYELEQLTGLVVGNQQFKLAVHNFVRDGEFFDAFPLQVAGALKFHAPTVFRALVKAEAGRRILEQTGDKLRLGLRVLVRGYAEVACAVWVVVGCCCVPVQGLAALG